jgi:geranylgeranyl pyrophosphate synthase
VSTALAATLRAEGGLLAGALREDIDPEPSAPAARAAAGPRSAGHAADIALLVEAIHEGHLLHYGVGRTVTQADPDLALLAGDRLYALGLDRLARLGDLDSVAALAEVIATCAQAYAADDPERAQNAWTVGSNTVGWGMDDGGQTP